MHRVMLGAVAGKRIDLFLYDLLFVVRFFKNSRVREKGLGRMKSANVPSVLVI